MRWQYPDQLEADFHQYYNLDVTDRELVPPAKAARLLFQLPRDCRVYTAIMPGAQWGWQEVLANKTNYLLEILVWMKTKDAQKKLPRNRPKPFMPDFLKGTADHSGISSGIEAHTTEDIQAILDKPRV